jgi:hypothetical protein
MNFDTSLALPRMKRLYYRPDVFQPLKAIRHRFSPIEHLGAPYTPRMP